MIILIIVIILVLLFTFSASSTYGGIEFSEHIKNIASSLDSKKEHYEDAHYKNVEKMKDFYVWPDSNNQIGAILQFGAITEYYGLCAALAKPIRLKAHKKYNLVHRLLQTYKDDMSLYKELIKHIDKSSEYSEFEEQHVVRRRYKEAFEDGLLYLARIAGIPVSNIGADAKYLDIGCGTGRKTIKFAELVGINETNIYCADVADWSILADKKSAVENHQTIDKSGKLPYDDNTFDLVSAFMALHHVENLQVMLDEITRILKPGGILFIRDHNAITPADRIIIDVEHLIYDYIKIPDFDQTKTRKYIPSLFPARGIDLMLPGLRYVHLREDLSGDRGFAVDEAYFCLYVKK